MTVYLENQVFGTLTVLEMTERRSQKSIIWKCLCKCGETVYAPSRDLISGNIKGHSGCPLRLTNRPLYSIYSGMLQRCYNTKSTAYASYGGRGIRVSEEWLTDYFTFESDMGPRPSLLHSIDRIDNTGNYCKENCRWADYSIQSTNQRPLDVDFEVKLYILLTMDSPVEISKITRYAYKTICNIRSFTAPEKYAIQNTFGFQSLQDIQTQRLLRLTEMKKLKELICKRNSK